MFMNLGDHLFFEPLGRLFKENGYNVSFLPIKVMEIYFKQNGFEIADQSQIEHYDLVISRPDFINDVKELKNVILIDIAYAGISKPLINGLIDDLSKYFLLSKKTDPKPHYFKPNATEDIDVKLNIDKNQQYIIFNNYIKSGSFRVGKKRFLALEVFLKSFILLHPNLKVIHTGSNRDKEIDDKIYDFVNIDLRGKTSPMELFDLCALPNIQTYIGFDAFLMHLFFLQNKKVYLMDRGRWSKKEVYFVKNYLQPPFFIENINELKQYIEY